MWTLWIMTGMSSDAHNTKCIYTYIPWIRKCVTKTVGCGRSCKYTNIHNFYSVKYFKHFTKQYYRSSLHIKKFTRQKKNVFTYFLKATLNIAFLFLRIVKLHVKLLKITNKEQILQKLFLWVGKSETGSPTGLNSWTIVFSSLHQ